MRLAGAWKLSALWGFQAVGSCRETGSQAGVAEQGVCMLLLLLPGQVLLNVDKAVPACPYNSSSTHEAVCVV